MDTKIYTMKPISTNPIFNSNIMFPLEPPVPSPDNWFDFYDLVVTYNADIVWVSI